MRKYLLAMQDGAAGFEAFEGSAPVAANQCWMECSMPEADELILRFGTSTGISAVSAVGAPPQVYNIAGQRLLAPQRGINIVEGKKVFFE